MPKIAVFDSGLGSLSIIKPIRKKVKTEIIYFADQENFPYGRKSIPQLRKIVKSTIKKLRRNFKPDIIVVASITPSLLLGIPTKSRIMGVYPPLGQAVKITKTKTIAILATQSLVKSNKLTNYIKKNTPKEIKLIKINATPLVELVESGKFISEKVSCENKIRRILKSISNEKVDIAVLSSTHLPFLLPILQINFPDVTFLDPAEALANHVAKILHDRRSKVQRLRIFASGDTQSFQKKLQKLGIRNKVMPL